MVLTWSLDDVMCRVGSGLVDLFTLGVVVRVGCFVFVAGKPFRVTVLRILSVVLDPYLLTLMMLF